MFFKNKNNIETKGASKRIIKIQSLIRLTKELSVNTKSQIVYLLKNIKIKQVIHQQETHRFVRTRIEGRGTRDGRQGK